MSQKNGCGSAIGRAVFWAVFCTLYNAVMNSIACILDDPEIRGAALALTVEQYHRLSAEGIVPGRTELLQGVT